MDNSSFFDECMERYPGVVRPFSVLYKAGSVPIEEREEKHNTVYRVENTDSISAAKELRDQGMRPLVLNFASERRPGGGYRKGAVAQEESLFYATTYALALDNPTMTRYYPLAKDVAIYSPNVLVIRDPNTLKLLKWKDCFLLDFVACPALRHPRLSLGSLSFEDEQTMTSKIRLILDVALAHGHDSLVLGAWGSGVFGCPPDHVAALFREALSEPRYSFKAVTFAVLVARSKDRPNLTAYQQAILQDVAA